MRNTFGDPMAADVARENYEASVPEEIDRHLGSPTLTLFQFIGLVILTGLIIADAIVSLFEQSEE